jgi:hypothetical protein
MGFARHENMRVSRAAYNATITRLRRAIKVAQGYLDRNDE